MACMSFAVVLLHGIGFYLFLLLLIQVLGHFTKSLSIHHWSRKLSRPTVNKGVQFQENFELRYGNNSNAKRTY